MSSPFQWLKWENWWVVQGLILQRETFHLLTTSLKKLLRCCSRWRMFHSLAVLSSNLSVFRFKCCFHIHSYFWFILIFILFLFLFFSYFCFYPYSFLSPFIIPIQETPIIIIIIVIILIIILIILNFIPRLSLQAVIS